MTSPARCPRCGIDLSADAPLGVCPQCLIEVGMESNTVNSNPEDRDEIPQTESFAGGPEAARRSPRSRADLPEPGELFGNFHLIRKLGEGGMGAVFEAEDLEGGRQVALKLLAHSLESREARNRFFREGRLAASINHPNSVYVYGTMEIDETPAISMEHISGGTLQDRVRQHGPFPVAEAVDVILQIIAGLDAAAKVGVLHRDIKPSNCFVDTHGIVKIGDFGLSITTEVRGDSHLTEPGSFLGTPAFSSPEQLRGDELDIRSDIYSVGVTLYYLLTGKTPFEADNLVKLLATVLEQPAISPSRVRSEVPNGLAKIVLRCLAKQPADRFANYDDLREALAPYDSNASTPATLALRTLAGILDSSLWSLLMLAIQFAYFGSFAAMTDPSLFQSTGYRIVVGVIFVLSILYFAIPEGLCGASLGKYICRLRVVDRNRSNIGVLKAGFRACCYLIFPSLIIWTYWIWGGSGPLNASNSMADPGAYGLMIAIGYSYYGLLALLFSSARRRNGYSGWHDLLTGSRVIVRKGYAGRPTLGMTENQFLEPDENETIGPYHVLESLHGIEGNEFLLAYDTRLLRRVWIHKLSDDSEVVSTKLRNLGRVGRLRWINGHRAAGENWDAYEALSGNSLLALLHEPQPWAAVSYWLMDLSYELSLAEQDGTLPRRLSLNQVWITAEGRAKLLDFDAPGTSSTGKLPHVKHDGGYNCKTSQELLFHVAASALQGRIVGPQESHVAEAATQLPIPARVLIDRLADGDVTAADAAVEFRRLAGSATSVTRLRRGLMLATTACFPTFIAVVAGIGWFFLNSWNTQYPEMAHLRNCMIFMNVAINERSTHSGNTSQKDKAEETAHAFEVYISGNFRGIIEDKQQWNNFYLQSVPLPVRARVQKFIQENPEPTEQELQEAAAIVEPIMESYEKSAAQLEQIASPWAVAAIQFASMWILFVMLPSMLMAIAFRRGCVMRIFGVDYVARSGRPASRLRMFWRCLVLHIAVLSAPILMAFVYPWTKDINLALLIVLVFVLGVTTVSMLLPRRGLPDRLSGTYPVIS